MADEKRPTLADFDFSKVEINPPKPTENKARVLLRIVEGAGVALWQYSPDSTPEVLIQRGNLYPTFSGYSWGYKGEGCKHLAFAMVSVIYEFDRLEPAELSERAYALVEKLISGLNSEQPYDLPVAYIRKTLGDHELPLHYRTEV
ncbi:hypothetical protein [Candidatus Pantoea soli]|uniref:Uncharacterized protein n=1 Tax=Candidatus Pantoea soli TaxID=3098669 RepID=A0A518XJW9_9GAMM|nr:hypothetical protein [Pantoea soli]QDY44482.1 hypothetical protein D8B20_21385 [Pantoea soli]